MSNRTVLDTYTLAPKILQSLHIYVSLTVFTVDKACTIPLVFVAAGVYDWAADELCRLTALSYSILFYGRKESVSTICLFSGSVFLFFTCLLCYCFPLAISTLRSKSSCSRTCVDHELVSRL
jgi:hypothetical protein